MKTSSDKVYEKYKDFDFADAKSVSETPHLAKLQAETGGKSGTIHETLETCLPIRSTGRAKKQRVG